MSNNIGNSYDDGKGSSVGDYYLVPNNNDNKDDDDDDILLVENDNYVYVVGTDEKETKTQTIENPDDDDDRRNDRTELKVTKSKQIVVESSVDTEKDDRTSNSWVRLLITFVVGMWAIVWCIRRGCNNSNSNTDPAKVGLLQAEKFILSTTNSLGNHLVVSNVNSINKKINNKQESSIIITDDDKMKPTDDDLFVIPVKAIHNKDIAQERRRGNRPSKRSSRSGQSTSTTTRRRSSRGGVKLTKRRQYSDDDDFVIIRSSTTKREYPTDVEENEKVKEDIMGVTLDKLVAVTEEDRSSDIIKSLQKTVGRERRQRRNRRRSSRDSRSMTTTTTTSERSSSSSMIASSSSSRSGKTIKRRGQVRVVRDSLVLDTNHVTYLSYDNYGTFIDTKTQPVGSNTKIVLVFYKPTYQFDLDYAPIINNVARNNGIAIGIINCCKNKRICNENKIVNYPTIRTYIQRLPKLDSTTQQIQYKRYYYETITDISSLKNVVAVTSIQEETPTQEEVKVKREYPNFDTNRDDAGTKEQRRYLAHNINNMIEPKREYPSMEIIDGKYKSGRISASRGGGSSLPKQQRLGRQRVLTQDVLDTDRIQLLSYKTFHDFFIGQTKGTKNQIIMVFHKPNNSFNVDVAPILNQLAELGEKIGVVHCSKYPQMCKDHSITEYPTIRWYSHDKYAIERAAKKHHDWNEEEEESAPTRKKYDEKTLWYEPTTIDTLKLHIQEKSNLLLLSTTTTEKIDLQERELHSSGK